MFCAKCGAKLDADARFCNKCGNPVSVSAGAEKMPAGSGHMAESENTRSNNSGEKKLRKGPLAAVLILAVVLAAGIGIFSYRVAHKEDADALEAAETENSPAEEVQTETEEVRPEAETKEPEQTDEKAELLASLENLSYYGDKSQCAMTREQAAAYAQLIADGLAGKVEIPECRGLKPVQDVVFWDQPYEVDDTWGGTYLTDRANIMLADFAGDGNPYLYVYSSIVEDSFQVYGWEENMVKLVINQEGAEGASRTRDYLFEDADGKVKVCEESSSGAGDQSIDIYLFSKGTAEKVYSLRVMEDGEGVHCIENGEETLYPVGSYDLAYEKMQNTVQTREEHTHIMPYTCFYEMQPNTLSEMMEGLNQYASSITGEGQEENNEDAVDAAALEQYRQFLQGELTAESPWLIRMKNCTIDVDLSACVPAEYLESIQRDIYHDALQKTVSDFYRHPEMITITQAGMYDETMIIFCIDDSDCGFTFYTGDGGNSWEYDCFNNARGSDYNQFIIIFDYGVPDNADDLYSACVWGENTVNINGEIWRTDYQAGDPVLSLRNAEGNTVKIPIS